MVAHKAKRKRNKATLIFLFPLFAFIFVAGWVISFIGEEKTSHKAKRPLPKSSHITIGAIPNEPTLEIAPA